MPKGPGGDAGDGTGIIPSRSYKALLVSRGTWGCDVVCCEKVTKHPEARRQMRLVEDRRLETAAYRSDPLMVYPIRNTHITCKHSYILRPDLRYKPVSRCTREPSPFTSPIPDHVFIDDIVPSLRYYSTLLDVSLRPLCLLGRSGYRCATRPSCHALPYHVPPRPSLIQPTSSASRRRFPPMWRRTERA